MPMIRAYAASSASAPLQPFEYDPGVLAPDQVEIAVSYCGVCHSDLSMLNNEWGRTRYPFVGGHEVVGTIAAVGQNVAHLGLGQRVGLGWYSASCMHCAQCLSGSHNLCGAGEQTIIGRFGGFAERVRCHWAWAVPLPEALDMTSAGPLFCGGITVFNPIVEYGVPPTDRVGVIGIGGLGHLALKFLNAWGCEVVAFTTREDKRQEMMGLGAHQTVATHDVPALKALAGSLNFLLVTANAPLNWSELLATLAPKGRMHVVGAVLEPIPVSAFGLIGGQKSISGSPVGSPATTQQMLSFCSRHAIQPQVEVFPMSRANEALEHLKAGKARYRVVLSNDFR